MVVDLHHLLLAGSTGALRSNPNFSTLGLRGQHNVLLIHKRKLTPRYDPHELSSARSYSRNVWNRKCASGNTAKSTSATCLVRKPTSTSSPKPATTAGSSSPSPSTTRPT